MTTETVTLDIPEDDDSAVISWCVKCEATYDRSTRHWQFRRAWFDSLDLNLGYVQFDNDGKAFHMRTRTVLSIDGVDIEAYRREMSNYIEQRWWWKLEHEFQKRFPIEDEEIEATPQWQRAKRLGVD